jgi:hypothetical protein
MRNWLTPLWCTLAVMGVEDENSAVVKMCTSLLTDLQQYRSSTVNWTASRLKLFWKKEVTFCPLVVDHILRFPAGAPLLVVTGFDQVMRKEPLGLNSIHELSVQAISHTSSPSGVHRAMDSLARARYVPSGEYKAGNRTVVPVTDGSSIGVAVYGWLSSAGVIDGGPVYTAKPARSRNNSVV